jgi:drug/metabolite transporter (DMT)-like permease
MAMAIGLVVAGRGRKPQMQPKRGGRPVPQTTVRPRWKPMNWMLWTALACFCGSVIPFALTIGGAGNGTYLLAKTLLFAGVLFVLSGERRRKSERQNMEAE